MRGFSAAGRQRRAEALARGEETQPPRMWSFREGLRLLIESLRDRCGARLLSGVAVRDVIRHESRWLIRSDRGETWDADAVALTCHAPEQAAQLRATDPELATLIAGIPYAKIAVVALGFRADQVGGALDGFGYIAPQSSRRDILGVQWCSSIFPDRAPQGMVIWRALCGGWHRPDVVDWDDDRLANAVRSELRLAQQVEAAPVFRQIIRWPRAIPQYHVGHARRVELIDDRATRWPGLFLGGNAYRGVAMNDCVEQSSQLAERLIERLNARADQST
jgi:oxygen-dependent protoporphyrinogen oxidase